MFINLCKENGFPSESLPILEKAYQIVVENPKSNELFLAAKDSILQTNEILFDETTGKIVEITNLHPYTLNIILCVACLEPLGKIYEKAKLKEKFNEYANALKSKLIKCKEKFDIWGIEEGFWLWMYHEWQCARLGRLNYEPFHHCCDVTYKGIKKGDPVVLIHIPGGKPLDMDEVMESLKLAYNHFKDRFDNGIVPFITHSWLLYPPFLNGVFKEGGNIQKFAGLFAILSQNTANFQNFRNVFGCEYPGEDLSNVPRETSLQRNMLQFIMQGNVMGEGYGIFLYDGNGIVKK